MWARKRSMFGSVSLVAGKSSLQMFRLSRVVQSVFSVAIPSRSMLMTYILRQITLDSDKTLHQDCNRTVTCIRNQLVFSIPKYAKQFTV